MTSKGEKTKVEVWIYCQDPKTQEYSFLILRTNQKRGAFWQPVTGSVEAGEALDKAALREATEETGLRFSGTAEPIGQYFDYEGYGVRFREYGFSLYVIMENGFPPKVQIDPHEHMTYDWVASDDALKKLKHVENAKILEALLQKLSGAGLTAKSS